MKRAVELCSYKTYSKCTFGFHGNNIELHGAAIGGIGTDSVDKDLLERRAGLEVVATHTRIDQSGESIV